MSFWMLGDYDSMSLTQAFIGHHKKIKHKKVGMAVLYCLSICCRLVVVLLLFGLTESFAESSPASVVENELVALLCSMIL